MTSLNKVMHSRFAAWMEAQVASGSLPTGELIVSHRGRIVMRHRVVGLASQPLGVEDVIYRVYSMTKPIVSLAIMLLFEEGKFQLSDPIWKFLGDKWKKQNMKVMDVDASQKAKSLVTVPAKKSITIHNLLTHTSGLSHGIIIPGIDNPLDTYYSSVGLATDSNLFLKTGSTGKPKLSSLQEFCDRLAECPLLFQPGKHWHYSYGIDLLGRIVEVVSGQNLEDFLQERLFRKIGMKDTSFILTKEKAARLCDIWLPPLPGKGKHKNISAMMAPVPYFSGSGGLYSTASDYMLFTQTLLGNGVAPNGTRVFSRKTLEWMTMNHLPNILGKATMREAGFRGLSDDQDHGLGFGLGFATQNDVARDSMIGSNGSYFWAGAAATHFWVDPKEDLSAVFCTQVMLADPLAFPILKPLRAIVYGAIDFDDKSGTVRTAPSQKGCDKCRAKL